MGATAGGIMGQMVGGQIGGISIELVQSGCIAPFTHWQMQFAVAGEFANAPAAIAIIVIVRGRFARAISSSSRQPLSALLSAASFI